MPQPVSRHDIKKVEKTMLNDLRERVKQFGDFKSPELSTQNIPDVTTTYETWVASAVVAAETEASEADSDRFSTFANTMESLTHSFLSQYWPSNLYIFAGGVADSFGAVGGNMPIIVFSAAFQVESGRLYSATTNLAFPQGVPAPPDSQEVQREGKVSPR
jgi:hypothetical protein